MQVSKSGNHIKLFFRFHEAACYMRTCKLKVVITRQRRALHTYTPGISQKVKRRCSAHAFFVSKKKIIYQYTYAMVGLYVQRRPVVL